MAEPRNCHINIGTGKELTIGELAKLIAEKVDHKGEIVFNTSKPDGTPRKLTDPSKLHNLGWQHKIELPEGVEKLYEVYIKGLTAEAR
jgi:GDP-L-fucose synthase